MTGVRGIAATWVVLLHGLSLLRPLDTWSGYPFDRLINAGYLAVDLFFILSGFVLAMSYNERRRNIATKLGLTEFFLNRIFRIVPLNTVCLVSFLAVIVLTEPLSSWPPERNASSFLAAVLLVQSWGPGSPTAWNFPAWSLSAEWLAYGLFPMCVVVAARVRSGMVAAGSWALCLTMLGLVMVRYGGWTLNHTWILGLPRCLFQFAAGIFLWRWLQLSDVKQRTADAFLFGGIVLLALSITVPILELTSPFAFSAIIVSCAARGRWSMALLGNRATEFLGEISFSLYLVHFTLFKAFVANAAHFSLAGSALTVRTGYLMVAIASVYVVSVFTWRYVELPGQAAGRRITARRQSRGTS